MERPIPADADVSLSGRVDCVAHTPHSNVSNAAFRANISDARPDLLLLSCARVLTRVGEGYKILSPSAYPYLGGSHWNSAIPMNISSTNISERTNRSRFETMVGIHIRILYRVQFIFRYYMAHSIGFLAKIKIGA